MSKFDPIWSVRFAGRVLCLLAIVVFGPAAAQGLSVSGHHSLATNPESPLEVGIGIEIDQITFVDQKSENYGAVVTIRAQWTDPDFAFERDGSNREVRVMTPEAYIDQAIGQGLIIPAFVIENQQSNRWIHQSLIAIRHDGFIRYFEKSSLTLQAPHFDFRKYPFDTQTFYFEIVSVYPEDVVTYLPLDDLSGLGDLLGEEEWILGNARMESSTTVGLSGSESSKVALAFEGKRHVMYYAIRIFLPMLVLITVSWSAFFLDEYRKRIEVAAGNLLVFVAFNWAISADLPKLGYITFLDFILQWMFVVTGLLIVFNVLLRRLKATGREPLARKLDNYVIKWIYPLGYAAIVGFAITNYLVVS